MIRSSAGAVAIAAVLVSAGMAHAQSSYATYERPVAASTSTGDRVERVYSVPAYEPYQPSAVNETAYTTATEPMPVYQDASGRPYGEGVDVTPTDGGMFAAQPTVLLPGDSGGPIAALTPQASEGEISFQQESETSRLLLALEETFAKRVSEVRAATAAQRKAMLAQFEKDAGDPEKVIGLAGRMRAAMAELDAAQVAKIEIEERQYNAAMLKVLESAPSRVE